MFCLIYLFFFIHYLVAYERKLYSCIYKICKYKLAKELIN